MASNMNQQATGTFEVSLNPLELNESGENETRSRMSINKRFDGDLQATSVGEMLTGMTALKGSAGYVAMERVTGTLCGRSGSFVLQHSGTMTRGAQGLAIRVVPDSGTDQLVGLSGAMNIIIAGGSHTYEFEYSLGEP